MGANQSTRKITVVNDEATGVIKISDSVVQRLKGEISGKPASEPARQPSQPVEVAPPPPVVEPPPPPPEPAAPPPVVEPPPPVVEPPSPPMIELPPPPPVVEPPPLPVAQASLPPAASEPTPQMQNAWQRPIIQYIEEPSLSALKVRQEKELELAKLGEYWKDRLMKEHEDHKLMEKLSDDEFNKSVEKVGKLFKKSGASQICRDERQAVMECYGNNTGQALNCRDTVRSFAACVNNERLKTLHPGG